MPQKPRGTGTQIHRQNVPAEDECEYYKRTVTIPILDYVLNDLRWRFNFTSIARVQAFYAVPSIMDKYSGTWKSKVREFILNNKEDKIDLETFNVELDTWEHLWLRKPHKPLPKNVTEVFTHRIQEIFPNMCQVLKLLAVTPVTTCSCERSISSLRTWKSYLRSTMSQVLFCFFIVSFHVVGQ